MDETVRNGAREKAASLPDFLARKEILGNVESLSWWEGEQLLLLLTSNCQRNFSGVSEFMFVLF